MQISIRAERVIRLHIVLHSPSVGRVGLSMQKSNACRLPIRRIYCKPFRKNLDIAIPREILGKCVFLLNIMPLGGNRLLLVSTQ